MPRSWKIKLGILLGLFALLLGGLIVFNLLDQSSPRVLPKPPVARLEIGPARVQPKIVSSGLHLVVLADDGSLWGVGYDDWGQAGGTRQRPNAWTSQFQRFPGGSNWQDVAAGGQATFAIRDDGTLWQWGAVTFGQLVRPISGPAQIGAATNWSAISASGGGVFGLRTDGTLWAWGSNLNGELGLGSSGSQTNPVPLTADSDWKGIAYGGGISAAVKSNGTVWAWGHFRLGDYLDGTLRDGGKRTPFQLGTNASFVRVQCLVKTVLAEDESGQLWKFPVDDGPQAIWHPLLNVPDGLSSWSADNYVAVALDNKGQAWVMGQNRFGGLASRWVRKSEDWLPVSGISNALTAMAHVGPGVLRQNGELWLWGSRYDDSEGHVKSPIDRVRIWLGRHVPSLKPGGYSRISAFEVVPWKAAEFDRTNGVAVGTAP